MNRFADLEASGDCPSPDFARRTRAPVFQVTVRLACGIRVTTPPRAGARHHQRMLRREMHYVRCHLVRWHYGRGLRFDGNGPASLVPHLMATRGLRAGIIALTSVTSRFVTEGRVAG